MKKWKWDEAEFYIWLEEEKGIKTEEELNAGNMWTLATEYYELCFPKEKGGW